MILLHNWGNYVFEKKKSRYQWQNTQDSLKRREMWFLAGCMCVCTVKMLWNLQYVYYTMLYEN